MKSAAVLSSLALVIAFQFGASLAADKPTVLVIGAGQSGQPTVRILLEQGYDVHVMVRDPSRVTDLPAAAAVVAGDVTRPDSLQAAFAGIDYVISTIGSPCTPFEPFPEGSGPEDIDYRGW
jgi:nucleoside-diphosphate-sugar epimerase